MIRIAVADDDRECTTQLCQYIEDFSRESGYNCDVTVYHDGDELVDIEEDDAYVDLEEALDEE